MVPNTGSNSDKETVVLIIRVRVMIRVRTAEYNAKIEKHVKVRDLGEEEVCFLVPSCGQYAPYLFRAA